LALRQDPNLANVLGLARNIRAEDGSRNDFETVFREMDHDENKGHLKPFQRHFNAILLDSTY